MEAYLNSVNIDKKTLDEIVNMKSDSEFLTPMEILMKNPNEPMLLGYAEDGKPVYSKYGIAPDLPFSDYYID